MSIPIRTGTGRAVQGHPINGNQDKDYQTQTPLFLEDGVTPKLSWYMGLALSKTEPEDVTQFNAVFAAACQAAQSHKHYNAAAGQAGAAPQMGKLWLGGINLKIMDGDDPMHAAKDGFAGHWIIPFSSSYQTHCFQRNGGAMVELLDGNACKKGYFYRVSGSTKPNESMGAQAAIYWNIDGIELVGYGQEISSGPSAEEMFKAPAANVAGMSTQPVASGAMPQLAAPQQQTMAPPQQQTMAPPQQQTMAPPQQAPGSVQQQDPVLMNAGEAPYADFVAAGWTDELLIQHGKATAHPAPIEMAPPQQAPQTMAPPQQAPQTMAPPQQAPQTMAPPQQAGGMPVLNQAPTQQAAPGTVPAMQHQYAQ